MPFAYAHHVDYDAAPARVFDALTDLDQRLRWVPMLIGMQRLDERPFGPGSVWEETYKTLHADDVDSTVRMEAVVVDRPVRYVLRQLSPNPKKHSGAEWSYQLTARGDGTRLHVRLQVDFGGSGLLGLLAAFLAKASGPFMARQLRDELQALQEMLRAPR